MSEPGCFVCDKQRGAIDVPGGCLHQDELVYASHGVIPEGRATTYLGTLFVEPRRHVSGLAELDEAEAQRFGALAARLARALKTSEGAEHVYAHVLGHHVDHLHLWLVPRYPGTPAEFLPMRLHEWAGAPRGGRAEIEALCARLRAAFASEAAPRRALRHVALVVPDYDEALAFFRGVLGFGLVEDTYVPEQDKRWLVVAPTGSRGTTLLLARAANEEQRAAIGHQSGGRVFLFLETDDFWRDYRALRVAGVRFVREPKEAEYGTVAVFADPFGNLWDLLQAKQG